MAATEIVVGNLMSIEAANGSQGGLALEGNTGVSLTDVYIHSYSLIFAQGEKGLISLTRVRGVRRPNTNRLTAGGYLAINLLGGSFAMTDFALSGNYDDLTASPSFQKVMTQ